MYLIKRYLLILIIILLSLALKAYYDTYSIEIRHYQIDNSSLGVVLNGYKIAHLSDLHIKNLGEKESKIIEILKSEKPDLIFISGDLIHFRDSYEPFLSFLQNLDAAQGIYCVLGNTEYSNENGSCILCHINGSRALREDNNQTFLRNSSLTLKLNGQLLIVIGVDDPVNERSDLAKAIDGVNLKNPSILLSHSPEIFEEAAKFGFDLILCGHNHGGQLFITKYLKEIIPLDPALEFIEGFYQKGKTLMYVSRGIGTSYLPFRFGVKPEITFFTFPNEANGGKIQTARIHSTDSTTTLQHSNKNGLTPTSNLVPPTKVDPINPSNPLLISNSPPKTIFAGLSLSDLLETFNFLGVFDWLGLASAPQHSNTVVRRDRSTASQHILFDFESNEDLKSLNWECHKWFELSDQHATLGKYSLKVFLPIGQYPGIDFQEIKEDWSKGSYLKMDIFNPDSEVIPFHIRIDDHQSGWEYAKRFDITFNLKEGFNQISIPTNRIKTNIGDHSLNLKNIERLMIFIPNNPKNRTLYIDHIRLE